MFLFHKQLLCGFFLIFKFYFYLLIIFFSMYHLSPSSSPPPGSPHPVVHVHMPFFLGTGKKEKRLPLFFKMVPRPSSSPLSHDALFPAAGAHSRAQHAEAAGGTPGMALSVRVCRIGDHGLVVSLGHIEVTSGQKVLYTMYIFKNGLYFVLQKQTLRAWFSHRIWKWPWTMSRVVTQLLFPAPLHPISRGEKTKLNI